MGQEALGVALAMCRGPGSSVPPKTAGPTPACEGAKEAPAPCVQPGLPLVPLGSLPPSSVPVSLSSLGWPPL